jgi:hypothetical protein
LHVHGRQTGLNLLLTYLLWASRRNEKINHLLFSYIQKEHWSAKTRDLLVKDTLTS